MAKSIVSLAVGLALQEKKIGSLDDRIAKYVPALADSAYGETSIRNLLRMSSGVQFSEKYDGKDDLAKFTFLRNTQGSVQALRAFTHREVEQGTRLARRKCCPRNT
jgi:CubicO group peptidase (beta-lactamase class C family)